MVTTMSSKAIIISAPLPSDLRDNLKQQYNIFDIPMGVNPSSVLTLKQCEKVVGIITSVITNYGPKEMDLFPSLKVISNFAVGFDNINIQEASQRNILVCNTPKVLDNAVADLAFGLIICVARDLINVDSYVRKGLWEKKGPPPLGTDIRGKTLGILGMGRIGLALAKIAKAFDMQVIYHNRNQDKKAEESGLASYRNRDDLFSESDFLSIHLPLNNSTRSSVGKREFDLMKSTSYLINTGRGAVINEPDLIDALKSGAIAGAGLDVMANEPISTDHPFCHLKNVVLQAHIGSATVETRDAMIRLATANLQNALQGKKPEAMVNPDVFNP